MPAQSARPTDVYFFATCLVFRQQLRSARLKAHLTAEVTEEEDEEETEHK